MAIHIDRDILGDWFFTIVEGGPHAIRDGRADRKHTAMGLLINIWVFCESRGEPDYCCGPQFIDSTLGAGAFDQMIECGLVVVDDGEARWTGPQKDPHWLRSAPAGELGAWATYVIRRGARGPVKIGRTKNLAKRIMTLQIGCAEPLDVLHQIHGDVEQRLHVACAAHRLRGEWFDGSDAFFACLAVAMEALR